MCRGSLYSCSLYFLSHFWNELDAHPRCWRWCLKVRTQSAHDVSSRFVEWCDLVNRTPRSMRVSWRSDEADVTVIVRYETLARRLLRGKLREDGIAY